MQPIWKINVFLYNHKHTLNWLRNRPGLTEIVRPGATRFATTFIALKSLHDHKNDLQALVISDEISDEFKQYLKMPKAKDVKQIVLDERFWTNSFMFVKVMTPMMRLLRICDSDEKAALGYVYEGMYSARNGIKELFKRKKHLYKPYTSIIKKWWDRMLSRNLHAAAYWLNPTFQYDATNFCNKPEIMGLLMDVICNQKLLNKKKLVDEIDIFRSRSGGFARDLGLDSCRNWMYGGIFLIMKCQTCKSWQLEFLVRLLLLDVSVIGVCLSVSILKREID
ncbi:uncharacterized protein [Euphorbia lathyris]|uniref:uncharacterized protein isoform X2 n=1 Tax=Euphorbia lathyris TaxID=212925 RepID=UPI0033141DB9